jgi:hypothetical protein
MKNAVINHLPAKRISFFLLYIAILFSFLLSCSKDADSFSVRDGSEAFATIVDAGIAATDGCGWMIQIDNQLYHPENLTSEFMINGKEVYIRYAVTDNHFQCGLAATEYPCLYVYDIFEQGKNCQNIQSYQGSTYSYKQDDCIITHAEINHDCLAIYVSYSGGCKVHDFMLFEDLTLTPLTFVLSHDAHGDACEAYINTILLYDLRRFQDPQKQSIDFTLSAIGYQKQFRYTY